MHIHYQGEKNLILYHCHIYMCNLAFNFSGLRVGVAFFSPKTLTPTALLPFPHLCFLENVFCVTSFLSFTFGFDLMCISRVAYELYTTKQLRVFILTEGCCSWGERTEGNIWFERKPNCTATQNGIVGISLKSLYTLSSALTRIKDLNHSWKTQVIRHVVVIIFSKDSQVSFNRFLSN